VLASTPPADRHSGRPSSLRFPLCHVSSEALLPVVGDRFLARADPDGEPAQHAPCRHPFVGDDEVWRWSRRVGFGAQPLRRYGC
jgi:hypothetical protein